MNTNHQNEQAKGKRVAVNHNQTAVQAQKPRRGITFNHNQTAVNDKKPRRGLPQNHNQNIVIAPRQQHTMQSIKEVVCQGEMAKTILVWQNKAAANSNQTNSTTTISPAARMKQQFAANGLLRSEPSIFGKSLTELVVPVTTLNMPAIMLANFLTYGVGQLPSRPFGQQVSDFLK